MRIHFDHEGLGFVLEILPHPILNNVDNKEITGVRKVNQVFLSESNFFRMHRAVVADDFKTIQEILSKVLDVSEKPSEIFSPYLTNKPT